MKYILKNKLTFIILAGCLILAFELLVLSSAKVEREVIPVPVIKEKVEEIDPDVQKAGRNWEEERVDEETLKRTFYTDNISYLADDGEYKSIDTNIKKSEAKGYHYENTANVFGTYFKEDSQADDLIKFQVGERAVTYSFADANEVKGQAEDNTFTYPNIYENIDAQYTITPNQLLEELIAQKEVTIDKITQKIGLEGVYFKEQKDGSIKFFDEKNKKLVWIIPAPVMYEKENKENVNFGLHYEIEKSDSGYLLSKVIDQEGKEWMKSATYPIVIDASSAFPSQAAGGYVWSSSTSYSTARSNTSGTPVSSGSYSTLGQRYSSSWYYLYRTFFWFNTSSLPDDITPSNVQVKFYGYQDYSTTNFDIVIVGGTQSANPPVSTDYNDRGTTEYSDTLNTGSANFHTGQTTPNALTIQEAYRNTVSTTGTTKYALVSHEDVVSSAPSSNEYITIYDADSAYDPILEVTYPDAPVGLSLASGNLKTTQINMALDDGYTGIQYWEIEQSSTGAAGTWSDFIFPRPNQSCDSTILCLNGSYNCQLSPNTCDIWHKNLGVDTPHYYRVRAIDTNNGVSDWTYSNPDHLYTLANPTIIGPDVKAEAVGQLRINSINAPAGNQTWTTYAIRFDPWQGTGYPATPNYIDYECGSAGSNEFDYGTFWPIIYKSTWSNLTRVMRDDGSCLASETLAPNTRYRVSVYAKNGTGQLNPNPPTLPTATEKYTWASTPTNPGHNSNTTSSIEWSWQTGGAQKDYYAWSGGSNSGYTNNTTWTQSGLLPDKQYTFNVYARNNDNEPGTTVSASAYTSANPPYLYVDLPADMNNTGQLDISWEVLLVPGGGSGNGKFDLQSSTDGINWNINLATDLEDTIYHDTGLSPNSLHYYRVRTHNRDGDDSAWSNVVSKYTYASKPINARHNSNTVNSITWAWDSGGQQKDFYAWNNSPGGNSGWIGGTTWTLSGLNPNTQYTFYVQARNGNDVPTEFITASAYTSASPPLVTVNLPSDINNTGQLDISWTATGSKYDVQTATDAGCSIWNPLTSTTIISYPHTGLNPNSFHCYRVRAYNSETDPNKDAGDWSTLDSNDYRHTRASKPINVSHDGNTVNSITWRWQSGGSQKDYYAMDNNNPAKNSGWIGSISWPMSGLNENTKYTLNVKARNNDNQPTGPVYKDVYTSLNPPSNLTVSVPAIIDNSKSLDLSVTSPPNGDQGDTGAKFVCNATETPGCHDSSLQKNTYNYTDNDLSVNTRYCYQVQYVNGDGNDWTTLYPSLPGECKYTRANVPNAPKLTKIESAPNKINVRIKEDDGNPHGGVLADTKYAVCAVYKKCSISGSLCTKDTECAPVGGICNVEFAKYVKWDGSAWVIDVGGDDCKGEDDTGHWYTFSSPSGGPPIAPNGWGGDAGVDVTAEAGKYTFKAKAKNEDNVATKFGPLATLLLVKNNLVGWAWSSNIGWLSMNCLNFYANPQNYYSCGQADNWGVNTYFETGRDINPLDGYAWSGTGQTQGYSWQSPVNVSETTMAAGADTTGEQYETGPSIALDSKGYPHIAWTEKQGNTGWDIYYIEWNGSKWVKADGTEYTHTELPTDMVLNVSHAGFAPRNYISVTPSLALYNDEPYIAFNGGASASVIFFLKWNGSDWVTVTDVDRDTAYNDESSSKLRVDYEYDPSLAVDKDGKPHVSFSNGNEVFYREWNGSNWVTASGAFGSGDNDANLNVSDTPSARSSNAKLVMGNVNETPQIPHIVWAEDVAGWDAGQIYYRWWNGTAWVDADPGDGDNNDDVQVNKNITGLFAPPPSWATGTTPPDDNRGGRPSMALYSDNTPGIVWRDYYQIVYRKWNQTLDKWTTVSDDNPTAGANLRLDDFEYGSGYAVSPRVAIHNDQPYVVFTHNITEGSPGQVYFRRWNGSAWIDQAGNNGSGNGGENIGIISQPANIEAGSPDLAVDSSGRPHVIWWKNTLENLGSGSCLISHCLSDADCSDLNFNQCVYYQGTDKTCANARDQSCTLNTQCPLNPPPQNCNNECNRCSAFDIFYTGWLPSAQTSGLGWVSFNQNVCSNDSQKVCTNATDCGGAPNTCNESAGEPPGVCSNNITLNCSADSDCGSGKCIEGYGYCYNSNNSKYGKCSFDSVSCTSNAQCSTAVDSSNHCVYYTCNSVITCPASGVPPDTCKITSTANADGLTRQIEGYARVLSQKDAGVVQGQPDWGWIKLAGQYGGPGMDADTAGLWHFNENSGNNAGDTSFNGNNGTLMNFTLPANQTWVEGKIGRGLDFDGADDIVVVNNNDSLNPRDVITIEMWVKPDSYPDAPGVYVETLRKEGMYSFSYSADYDWQIGIRKEAGGDAVSGIEKSEIPVGQWTYLAMTYDGSNVKVYVNGGLEATIPYKICSNNPVKSCSNDSECSPGTCSVPGIIGNNLNGNLTIGGYAGLPRYFDGAIDEVRITHRALTDAEITEEYTSGPYLLSLLEVNSQDFFADPDVNANEVKLYSAFGFAWSSRTSPGFGWVEFMPAGAIIGIPWLQTLYGDIFAKGGIQLAPPPRGSGKYTSTYLIQSDGSIVGVPGYYMSTSTGPPTSEYYPISQMPSGSYQYQPIPGVTDVLSKIDVDGLSKVVANGENKYGYDVVTNSGRDISTIIGASPLNQNVYYFDGDSTVDSTMTILNGPADTDNGSGLIIVDGDLTINQDIYYEYGKCNDAGQALCQSDLDCDSGIICDVTLSEIENTKQLASVAWFVRGNIYINPLVRELAGAFVAAGKDSEDGIISTARVTKPYPPIANNSDDVYARSGGPVDSTILKFGSSTAGGLRSFLRWQVDVPKGSVIKKAFIKIKANAESAGGNFTAKQFLLDGYPTAADFSNPYGLATKSGAVNYSTSNWNGTDGSWNELSDISTLVQKFIDRDDYAPNDNTKGYIGLSIQQGDTTGDNYKTAYTIEGGGAPELVIEYSSWVKEYKIPNTAEVDDATAWSDDWDASSSRVDFGWNDNRAERAYLRWSLSLPKDSEIKKAYVELNGNNSNPDAGSFKARLGLLDKDDIPAFTANPYGDTATYGDNLAGSEVAHEVAAGAWDNSTWYKLTEITRLVQDWMDRDGYTPGNYLGIRIRRDTNETVAGSGESRSFDSASIDGAKLSVEYRSRLDVAGLMASRGYNFDREYVKGLEPAEKIVYDGRVMVNTPPGLGDFSKLLPVYQQVIP